jgi:hypothetical protein
MHPGRNAKSDYYMRGRRPTICECFATERRLHTSRFIGQRGACWIGQRGASWSCHHCYAWSTLRWRNVGVTSVWVNRVGFATSAICPVIG